MECQGRAGTADGAAGTCPAGLLHLLRASSSLSHTILLPLQLQRRGEGFAAGPQSGSDGLSSTERQKFGVLKDIFTWALSAP